MTASAKRIVIQQTPNSVYIGLVALLFEQNERERQRKKRTFIHDIWMLFVWMISDIKCDKRIFPIFLCKIQQNPMWITHSHTKFIFFTTSFLWYLLFDNFPVLHKEKQTWRYPIGWRPKKPFVLLSHSWNGKCFELNFRRYIRNTNGYTAVDSEELAQ